MAKWYDDLKDEVLTYDATDVDVDGEENLGEKENDFEGFSDLNFLEIDNLFENLEDLDSIIDLEAIQDEIKNMTDNIIVGQNFVGFCFFTDKDNKANGGLNIQFNNQPNKAKKEEASSLDDEEDDEDDIWEDWEVWY